MNGVLFWLAGTALVRLTFSASFRIRPPSTTTHMAGGKNWSFYYSKIQCPEPRVVHPEIPEGCGCRDGYFIKNLDLRS